MIIFMKNNVKLTEREPKLKTRSWKNCLKKNVTLRKKDGIKAEKNCRKKHKCLDIWF